MRLLSRRGLLSFSGEPMPLLADGPDRARSDSNWSARGAASVLVIATSDLTSFRADPSS
jgi:hypothetical protein